MKVPAAAALLLTLAGCAGSSGDRVFRAGDCFSVSMTYRDQGEARENDRLVTIVKEGEGKIYMHPVDEVRVGGLSPDGIRKAVRDKAAARGVDVLDVRVEFHGRIELPDDPQGLLDAMVLSDRPAGPDPVFSYPPMTLPGEKRALERPHENPVYRAQLAVGKMFDLGVDAFPVLVEHLDDGRQSVAVLSIVPCTVAAACYGILDGQVHVPLHKGVSPDFDFLDGPDIPLWWRERKGRSLREIRVEAAVYTLRMAESRGDDGVAQEARKRLESLGASEWETAYAAFEAHQKRYVCPPGSAPVQDLVDLLAVSGQTYVERRFGRLRADDAWGILAREKREAAIPLLVAHADDPEKGEACVDVLRRIVEDELHGALFDVVAELSAIRRETVRTWWESRSSLTLRELRLDAARHWLRRIEEASFPDEESRGAARDHVRKVLRALEADR